MNDISVSLYGIILEAKLITTTSNLAKISRFLSECHQGTPGWFFKNYGGEIVRNPLNLIVYFEHPMTVLYLGIFSANHD